LSSETLLGKGWFVKSLVLNRKMVFSIVAGLVAILGMAILTHADTPSKPGLSIDVEGSGYATYTQTNNGCSFHAFFTIINNGQTDATIVTENLVRAFYGVDNDTNSLRCTLSFNEPQTYKDKYPVAPSIYKCSPVTLKPGEAAPINYYEEISKANSINYMPILGQDELKAKKVVLTYEVPTSWGKRLDLWQGQIHSAPIEFSKNISNGSK
jgi:hypothetical protein